LSKTLVVNLFGGPGCGKSTITAGLFSALKWKNICCEMSLEYAKDCVFGENTNILKNQVYVFGKQQNRLFRLNGKVDVVITDSPLILSLVYDVLCRKDLPADYREAFHNFIIKEQAQYNNLNIFLRRVKPYHKEGRLQSEKEARELDFLIRDVLNKNNIAYIEVIGEEESIPQLVGLVKTRLDLAKNPCLEVPMPELENCYTSQREPLNLRYGIGSEIDRAPVIDC